VTGRRRLGALFGLYLALLGWAVLWKLDVPWTGSERVVKLVPFVATRQAGASAPSEVAANLLLFVPFGVYLGLLRRERPGRTVAPTAAGASLALELAQYVLGVGRSDTTDIIVNTAGALAGLAVLALVRRRLRVRTVAVLVRVCVVGTAVAVVGAALYVASPWQVVHVRDAGPLARLDSPGRG
jgi:glycopeptide antibiotics resistance protein